MINSRNKKLNSIKFGKGTITLTSLVLPAIITTTTHAMIGTRNTLSKLVSSSSSSTLKSTFFRSTGNLTSTSSNTKSNTPLQPNISGNEYKSMAGVNTGFVSRNIQYRIRVLQSSISSNVSSTSPSPFSPKGDVNRLISKFNNPSTSTTPPTSPISNFTPKGNVTTLTQKFSSYSTNTTPPSSSPSPNIPKGDVNSLIQKFSSSSASTTSSSNKNSTPSKSKVASIAKIFNN